MGSEKKAEVRDLLEVIPSRLGPRMNTGRGGIVHTVRPAGSMAFKSPVDFGAVLLSPLPRMRSKMASDRDVRVDAPVGTLVINPANVDSSSTWHSTRESLAVGYAPGELKRLAAAEFDVADLRLHPPGFGHVDRKALQIALLMKQGVVDGTASDLYVDSMLSIFALHLLRNYSNASDPARETAAGRLSPPAAKRVMDFLHENFAQPLSISRLAALSGLSPGRFIKAFGSTFGQPPHQYLVNLRLEAAERLLVDTDLPVAHVAAMTGFSSQSHLTTTMSRHKFVTPGQIRKSR
jgi:AraC family transcriptional regulator